MFVIILDGEASSVDDGRLWGFMSARCVGWDDGKEVRANQFVWRSFGHGHGQIHDECVDLFPMCSVSELVADLPGARCAGHLEPLHPHVCDVEHGRTVAQDDREGAVVVEFVLHEARGVVHDLCAERAVLHGAVHQRVPAVCQVHDPVGRRVPPGSHHRRGVFAGVRVQADSECGAAEPGLHDVGEQRRGRGQQETEQGQLSAGAAKCWRGQQGRRPSARGSATEREASPIINTMRLLLHILHTF